MIKITIAKVAHATRCPYPVYVGRPMPKYKAVGLINIPLIRAIREGSPLGNPFRPGHSFQSCIGQYKNHLDRNLLRTSDVSMEFARLVGLLDEQKHISLVCWCARAPRAPYASWNHEDACHADVIAVELLRTFGIVLSDDTTEQLELFGGLL